MIMKSRASSRSRRRLPLNYSQLPLSNGRELCRLSYLPGGNAEVFESVLEIEALSVHTGHYCDAHYILFM